MTWLIIVKIHTLVTKLHQPGKVVRNTKHRENTDTKITIQREDRQQRKNQSVENDW